MLYVLNSRYHHDHTITYMYDTKQIIISHNSTNREIL